MRGQLTVRYLTRLAKAGIGRTAVRNMPVPMSSEVVGMECSSGVLSLSCRSPVRR